MSLILPRHRSKAALGAVDPNFASVTLLLHCDGADTSTTFTDSSNSAHTITVANDAQLKTAQKKFGTASGYFDGTADRIYTPSSADFAYGTGDFTWEFWLYATDPNWATDASIYLLDHGTNGGTLVYDSNVLKYYNATTGVQSMAGTISASTWTFISVSRVSGITYVSIDGASPTSFADSHNYGTQAVTFGDVGGGGATNSYFGYVDDVRITKGVGRYNSSFTPPTQAFPDK